MGVLDVPGDRAESGGFGHGFRGREIRHLLRAVGVAVISTSMFVVTATGTRPPLPGAVLDGLRGCAPWPCNNSEMSP